MLENWEILVFSWSNQSRLQGRPNSTETFVFPSDWETKEKNTMARQKWLISVLEKNPGHFWGLLLYSWKAPPNQESRLRCVMRQMRQIRIYGYWKMVKYDDVNKSCYLGMKEFWKSTEKEASAEENQLGMRKPMHFICGKDLLKLVVIFPNKQEVWSQTGGSADVLRL